MKRILLVVVFSLLITGCENNIQEACPPLPVEDGFVTVKMKVVQKDGGLKPGEGGPIKFDDYITLRLPEYADVTRGFAVYGECEYAKDIFIRYVWYKGKLIPGWDARADIPSGDFRRVAVHAREGGIIHLNDYKPTQPWRYSTAIPHKYYPLVYYPRYRWESEAGPEFRSSGTGLWGVLDTKYRAPGGRLFITGCSIATTAIQAGSDVQPIETPMSDYGDSNCSGVISFEKNDKIVKFGIINMKNSVPEINHIYDAVYEEVQQFIQ